MEVQKSFYSIIPATVRYDMTLSNSCKLLYAEITALCNEKGYCWASNSYLAESFNVSKSTIKRWIGQLKEQGYIYIELVKKSRKTIEVERNIYISEKFVNIGKIETIPGPNMNPGSEMNLPQSKNEPPPGSKVNLPGFKNELYNNIDNNIIINQSINQDNRIDKIENTQKMESVINTIKEKVSYFYFAEKPIYKERVDEIINIMADVIISTKNTIRIEKEDKPIEMVKKRFLELDETHIEYVLDRLDNTTSKIINIKNYILTCLYNSTSTMDSYYSNLYNYHKNKNF